jgi:hypothetical protein
MPAPVRGKPGAIRSDGEKAAIDVKLGAGDVGRLVGSEEQHRVCDLLDSPGTAQRHLRAFSRAPPGRRSAPMCASAASAGVDRVDPDVVSPVVHGGGVGQRAHRALRMRSHSARRECRSRNRSAACGAAAAPFRRSRNSIFGTPPCKSRATDTRAMRAEPCSDYEG